MRVAELERRLEEQRTNFNNHVPVHNKGIRKHIKLVKTEMARDAKNLDSAKGMVTDDAMKQVLTSTYDRRVRCTPMLGRSYWPMLAMLSLPYAGYAGLNKRVEYQHTRVLTGYRGAHPPARSASPSPGSTVV